MYLINPTPARKKRRKVRTPRSAWITNPGGKSMARRKKRRKSRSRSRTRRRTSSRRRGSKSKRSAAAKKGWRTRRRKTAKRRAAGRKGARKRKSSRRRKNPSRRRSSRRRNPSRRRRRNPTRRRSSRRRNPRRRTSRRRNPGIVKSITSSLRSLTKPKTYKMGLVDGLSIGAGYAAVNALRSIEGRFGLDNLMASLPGGPARAIGEYLMKFVNTNLAAAIANIAGKKFANNVKAGGWANIGVSLLSDVSGMFGGYGSVVRENLSGMGDYNLAFNQGQAMHPYPAMGNYNLVGGGQAMTGYSAQEVYPDASGIY